MYRNCRHVQPNGLRCKSPAMRGSLFCYFHARLHGPALELPPPDNLASISDSVAMVLSVLASGRIDECRAKVLLNSLRLAEQFVDRSKPPKTQKSAPTPAPHTPKRKS